MHPGGYFGLAEGGLDPSLPEGVHQFSPGRRGLQESREFGVPGGPVGDDVVELVVRASSHATIIFGNSMAVNHCPGSPVEDPRRYGRIPAIIRDPGIGEQEPSVLLMAALTENIGRSDLSDAEKADAITRLRTLTGWSVDEVARRMGLQVTRVYDLMKLGRDEPVRAAAAAGDLTQGQAVALGRLDDTELATRLIAEVQGRSNDDTLLDGPDRLGGVAAARGASHRRPPRDRPGRQGGARRPDRGRAHRPGNGSGERRDPTDHRADPARADAAPPGGSRPRRGRPAGGQPLCRAPSADPEHDPRRGARHDAGSRGAARYLAPARVLRTDCPGAESWPGWDPDCMAAASRGLRPEKGAHGSAAQSRHRGPARFAVRWSGDGDRLPRGRGQEPQESLQR